MKAHTANLINAIVLSAVGSWGYFGSMNPSFTALIPVVVGIILLLMNKGVKNENKVVAHIAVLLTLIILIALIKPLTGAFDRNNSQAIFRVIFMMSSSVFAMVFFVKSFVDARKGSSLKK